MEYGHGAWAEAGLRLQFPKVQPTAPDEDTWSILSGDRERGDDLDRVERLAGILVKGMSVMPVGIIANLEMALLTASRRLVVGV